MAGLLAILLVAAACSVDSSVDVAPDAPAATTAPTATATTESEDEPSPSPPSEPTEAPPVAEFTPDPVVWQPCGDEVECGTVTVPLDYADPDGQTIDLALARLPATQPDERIGSLLVNPGGPGGSGIDFAIGGAAVPAEVAARFDIVGWDPRGVSRSDGLDCAPDLLAFYGLDPSPEEPAEQQALDEAAQAAAQDCGVAHTDLLPHLGTDNVVEDLDQIRKALGEEQINYLGFSYGTLIGALYADRFGANARALVLDGVLDPALDFEGWLENQTAAFDATVREVLGPLDAGYDEVVAAAEAGELRTSDGSVVGPAAVANGALLATYDEATYPVLRGAVEDALAGDGSGFAALNNSYLQFGDFPAYTAISCVDGTVPEGSDAYAAFADRLAEVSPRFGPAVANELLSCAFWPIVTNRDVGPVTGADAPPVLVIGNTGDAATPYHQAVAVADQLDTAVLLTHEGAGHTSTGSSACVDQIVAAYLIDLAVPEEGLTCT